MFKYIFLIAIRNIFRDKQLAFVNISGLALAFAAFILINQFVAFEKSYDNFHPDAENIYRIITHRHRNSGVLEKTSLTYSALNNHVKTELPEVATSARMQIDNGVIANKKNESFRTSYHYVDPEIIDVFSIPLIRGNRKTCLDNSGDIIISESSAKRFFGHTNVVGEHLKMSDSWTLQVKGVFKDIPENSHLEIDMMISWAIIDKEWGGFNHWGECLIHNYLKVKDETDTELLQQKLNSLLNHKNFNDPSIKKEKLVLQPVSDIHLKSHLQSEQTNLGSNKNMNLLFFLAFALLAIAWFNSINLYAAKSLKKSDNAIHYVALNFKKRNLYSQFFFQLFIVNTISFILALIIIWLIYPVMLKQMLLPNFFSWNDWLFWWWFLIIFLTGVILSSIYPFYVFYKGFRNYITPSKFHGKQKKTTDKLFVIIQLAASIFLFSGFLIVNAQIKYMKNKELGFNKQHKMILIGPNADTLFFNREIQTTFRNELSKSLGNKTISVSGAIPGQEILRRYDICATVFDEGNIVRLQANDIDEHFMPLHNINIIAGRNFDPIQFNEKKSVIINLKTSKLLGFDSPQKAISEYIYRRNNSKYKIIGVSNNYHHRSSQYTLSPMIFFYWKEIFPWIHIDYYTIPINRGLNQQTIKKTKFIWKKFFPNEPFVYFFLDEYFNKQYNEERKFSIFFGFFSALTLIIIALGIFSISMFMINSRAKEVGMRKVNGAKSWQVLFMILKEYLIMLSISIALSVPLSIYVMNHWLEHYAYKITINPFFYIVSGMCITIVTFLTVTLGTWKTANQNPVDNINE